MVRRMNTILATDGTDSTDGEVGARSESRHLDAYEALKFSPK